MNVVQVACTLALSLSYLAGAFAREVPRHNVLVILTDDLGYADLGCYGARDIETPHIDALAAQGVRLTSFYSNGPVCTPTRAALMTGRWQQRVGLEWAIGPGLKEPGLPATETSLAQMLKTAGYATGLSGKWHLGYKSEFSPGAHGFEEFYGLLSGNVDHYTHREINGELDWYDGDRPLEVAGYSTELITDRAVDFLNRHRERRFFLYVAYNAVHWPFQRPGAPRDTRTRETWFDGTRADYAAMTEAVDTCVGRLLEALERHGLVQNTLVVFTNDNGGERLSDNGPFFHHKGTLWEGGVRVPCVMRLPGVLPAGAVSAEPALTMDLTATILTLCGAAPPAGRPLDGINLLEILSGREKAPLRPLCWRIDRKDRQQKSIRYGNWKLLRDGSIEQLFDLAADPSERVDLARQHPQHAAELRRLLAAWEADLARDKPAFEVK